MLHKSPILILLFCFLTAVSQAAPPATRPSFEMKIHPVRGGGAEVTAVRVRWRLDRSSLKAGETFSLDAPITYAGRTGIADRVDSLTIRDAAGLVPFSV